MDEFKSASSAFTQVICSDVNPDVSTMDLYSCSRTNASGRICKRGIFGKRPSHVLFKTRTLKTFFCGIQEPLGVFDLFGNRDQKTFRLLQTKTTRKSNHDSQTRVWIHGQMTEFIRVFGLKKSDNFTPVSCRYWMTIAHSCTSCWNSARCLNLPPNTFQIGSSCLSRIAFEKIDTESIHPIPNNHEVKPSRSDICSLHVLYEQFGHFPSLFNNIFTKRK